jgi:flagellar biogenesis protein FliO
MSTVARVEQLDGRWKLAWRWVHGLRHRLKARPEKLLRLTETLSLGERRFLAVVEFEQQKFLIGGTASSMCLLAELHAEFGSRMFSTAQRKAQRQMEDVWP